MKILLTILLALVGAFGLFILPIRMKANKSSESHQVKNIEARQFKNGDMIFQTSKSSQSKAIQLATKSRYSHMGLIYETDGQYYVYEAVQPVKLTQLDEWIKRGKDSYYVVKRLKDSNDLRGKKAKSNYGN